MSYFEKLLIGSVSAFLVGLTIGIVCTEREPSHEETIQPIVIECKLTIEEDETEIVEETIVEEHIEEVTPEIIDLGEFVLTAYCPCKKCCGKTPDHPAYGITSTGVKATEGRTIAVDPKIIPYGTEVIIDDHTYVAEDSGGAIKKNRIDVYFDDHQSALNFGRQVKNVSIVKAGD